MIETPLSIKAQHVLMVIATTSMAIAAALGIYLAINYVHIASTKLQLQGQLELQQEIIRSSELTGPFYPHVSAEVSYVLNPLLKESNYKAPENHRYRINSLGLRGEEITNKHPGKTRVAIVGDSVAFGWKLGEKNKFSATLMDRLRQGYDDADQQFEFVTIALPGWNTRDQVGFLRHHLDRINPDKIVWFVIENDIHDSAGVLPSGQLANWASPHSKRSTPFNYQSHANRHRYDFSPFIIQKWKQNIDSILHFTRQYRIPAIFITSESYAASIDLRAFEARRVIVPDRFIHDSKWEVSKGDQHPSAWANRLMSIGVLRKMGELDWINAPIFTPEEENIAQMFVRADRSDQLRDENIRALKTRALKSLGDSIDTLSEIKSSLIFGVNDSSQMNQEGALLLSNKSQRRFLKLLIKDSPFANRFQNSLSVTLESVSLTDKVSDKTTKTITMTDENQELTILVPESMRQEPLLQLSWLFERSTCSRVDECIAAELVSIRLTD